MNFLVTLFAFSLAILHGCHANSLYECPRDDVLPCDCVQAYGKVFLQCSKLANRQQLSDAFKKMFGYGITQLQITNSNVSYIPRDLFKASPVSRISIKNSMMFYLFDRDLEKNAEHVTEIELDHVYFEGGLDWNVLDNLKSLKTLSVYGTNVESVPYGASELELPLETLVLEGNYIELVHEKAFQNLKNLKNLKLSKNFLKQYARSMLPRPSSGIQFLDLSHNNLKSLPGDAFDGMTELHSLFLRGNSFTVLEKSYMSSVFSTLTFLDVALNPLLCNCELIWLLSDSKPFHLIGECSPSQDKTVRRNLKDLTNKDFTQCS